ncbi:unnamed protein product [Phytophthora fragariaefolia]|uniref:Unnamed protein product n=1 Tax=Phytophthora fragariaefolia TaxID=1490495 RepID=A0A9W7CXQ8_9STRA|nr:unnamed protein product [Phytophthora fragariaefolia]
MIKKKLPWNVIFAERTKVLYYHDASKLSADTMRGLKKHVEFMKKFCQAWWDLLHWITINLERDAASQRLYKLRRRRTDSLIRRYKTHLKKLRKIKDFPETLFQEPGIWPRPTRLNAPNNEPEEEDDEDDNEMSEVDDEDEEDVEEEEVEEEERFLGSRTTSHGSRELEAPSGAVRAFCGCTTPPAGWITNIHVVAIDQPQCVCGDYAAERKKANGGDSASKLVPPLRKTVDLTGATRGPANRSPSNLRPRENQRPRDEAREALPGPQVWRKLRHDLRYVMRNGFTYEDANELVSGEHDVHPFIHHEPLVEMLVSIIRSDGLDAVPWTSFVPEIYYLSAEVRLKSMFDRGEKPEPWFSSGEEYVQDGLEPLSFSSSRDSEYEQEDDVEPDDSDTAPKVPATVVPAKQSSPAAKRKLDMLESGEANQKEGSTLRRLPRNQSKAKPTQSGSAVKKARLAAKVIEQLTESPRKATALARIPFKRLTLEQLSVIETLDPATTTSYRCSGIKMCFYQKKSKPQTIGFPNYSPQKCDMKFLEERWIMELYVTLFPVNSRGKMIKKKLPWNVMFAEHTKVLYYHDASKLIDDTMRARCCFSETLQASPQAHRLLIRRYKTHLKKLREIKDFPETLFQEPGIWPLPQRICNWVWEDSRVVDSDGEPKPLRQQLVELDEREPARTLWATAANEVERTKYVSADLRANRSIPLPQRARNWIVPDRSANEPEEEDDEDDDEMSEVDDKEEEDVEEEDVEEEEVEEEEVVEGDTGESNL